MKITLSNHIEITCIDSDTLETIEKHCTHQNPAYWEAKKQGRYCGDVDRFINLSERTENGLIVPIGLLDYLRGSELADNRNMHPVSIPFNGKLRDYQKQIVIDARKTKGGVIVAATGAGKTVSGIALAARLGQRSLILVKSRDLAKQWQESIKQYTGLDAGLIGGGKRTEGAEFTIGIVQTLVKRDCSELNYGLVIGDEIHNAPASQFYNVIGSINARYKFGLSATPQRRDSLEFMIFAAVGPICATVSTEQLTNKVLPVEVKSYSVPFDANVESWQEFISELIDNDSRNDFIVRAAKHYQAAPIIILCSQVRHCEILTTLTREAGLSPLLIHGQLPAKERLERMEQAKTARLIIGTAQLLGEGIDLPQLEVLIFAVPMSAVIDKSGDPAATKLIQSIGRCRRPHPGKINALVIDIVDKCGFGVAAYKKRLHIYKMQGFKTI